MTFACWEAYQRDARALDFSPPMAQLLDSVVQRARTYNTAMQQTREATIPLLAAQIRSARQTLQEATTPEGSRPWLTFERNARERQRRPATGSEPPVEQAWYAALQEEHAPDQLARMWVTGLFTPSGTPPTLGWLLARRTDQAAHAVLAVFPSGAAFATAPVEWVQGILDHALADLVAGAGYETVWTAGEALLKEVQTAETKMLAALRAIREQSEGGPPLV